MSKAQDFREFMYNEPRGVVVGVQFLCISCESEVQVIPGVKTREMRRANTLCGDCQKGR